MKLVRNSGELGVISVHVVKENDRFDYELGDDEFMKHMPALTNRGKTVGAYSIVTLKDGSKSRKWMDIDQIEAIRKRSRSGTSGPWVTDFDEMARKTVFRRHAKRLPKLTDIDELLAGDDEDHGLARPADVVNISTGEPGAKKQTRAAKAVKEAAADTEKAAADDDTIVDAEFADVTDHEPNSGTDNEAEGEEIPI